MIKRKKQLIPAIFALLGSFALLLGTTTIRAELGAVGSHAEIQCIECHDLFASLDDNIAPRQNRDGKCVICHIHDKYEKVEGDLGFHLNENRKCADCHSFHKTESIAAGGRKFEFNFDDSNLRLVCSTCHGVPGGLDKLSDGHRMAANAAYHRDYKEQYNSSPSQSCLSCHGQQNSLENREFGGLIPPVFNEEASHPYGVIASPRMTQSIGSNRQITLFNGKIECLTCHDLTSTTPDYLKFSGSYDKLCLDCHDKHTKARP